MDFAVIDATVVQPPPLSAPGSCRYETTIANVPLIRHVLADLAASGIVRAQVVAHPEVSGRLRTILPQAMVCGVELTWADTGSRADAGSRADTGSEPMRDAVLAAVHEALATGPVLLHPGDSLLGEQMRAMVARFETGDVDAVLSDEAEVAPSPVNGAERPSSVAVMLGSVTRPVIEALRVQAANGLRVVDSLRQSEFRVAVCATTRHWTYADTAPELLAANRMLLDSLPVATVLDERRGAGEVRGRVSIDPGASLPGSVVHGPAAVDAGAVVEDSFVGPYTAIGAGVVIRGAEITNTMVLRGAEISHPPGRIEGSIIGERCEVTGTFALPRGLHMHLAPGSRLTLS